MNISFIVDNELANVAMETHLRSSMWNAGKVMKIAIFTTWFIGKVTALQQNAYYSCIELYQVFQIME